MAKRELSNTLRNLKFMQRAVVSQKPDKTKEEEIEKKDQNENQNDDKITNPSPFGASPVPARKCVVIIEGNPHPGAIRGRMSFQSFNPNIDKLNGEAANNTSSVRVDGSTSTSNEPDPDLKRKNRVSESDKPIPNKLQKNINGDIKLNNQPSSSNENNTNNGGNNNNNNDNNKRKEFKKPPKRDKLDWSVLRPPRKP